MTPAVILLFDAFTRGLGVVGTISVILASIFWPMSIFGDLGDSKKPYYKTKRPAPWKIAVAGIMLAMWAVLLIVVVGAITYAH